MIKVAFIVGHNRDKRGAVRKDTNETEYEFNSKVAAEMQSLADSVDGVAVRVFRREPGQSYGAQIRKVYAETDQWGADATIEGHFNSLGNPSANGCETLSSGSVTSLAIANSVNTAIVDAFGVKDRGIRTRASDERGGGSLHTGRAPAILLEPFFGSNPDDCRKFAGDDAPRKLAAVVLEAAVQVLSKGRPVKPKVAEAPAVRPTPVSEPIPVAPVATRQDPEPEGFFERLLGKYAPQGSNTSRAGYLMMLAGVVLYLAQGPVPALAPVVALLESLKLIEPGSTGVSAFIAGFLAVTGRASLR